MQVMDEEKRLKILAVAAELFATQPFHRVLLSDVAAAAGVGKGTLYTYFSSKEDLYLSVLYSGFSRLVGRLRDRVKEDACGPAENLDGAIREIVGFAYLNPHLFDVMRTPPGREAIDRDKWDVERRELIRLVESIIRQGIARGEFVDPNPELTARYIPGLVRSALLEGVHSVPRQVLTDHLLWFVRTALKGRETGIEGGFEAELFKKSKR